MRRQFRAVGTLVATAVLWPACAGDESFNAGQQIMCSTNAECDPGSTGLLCIDARCVCPARGDDFCCDKASETTGTCNRQCRDVAACGGTKTPCDTTDDCSGPSPADPRCEIVACTDAFCEVQRPEIAATQRVGDCTLVRCNEKGETYDEAAPDDAFDDLNQCTDDRCNGTKSVNAPRARGEAPYSSGFCDGAGHLVDCIADGDCADPVIACSPRGACVPSWCVNGGKDTLGGETAIDCGGPCDPCETGQACTNLNECVDRACGSNGKCTAATCDDRMTNGAETGVDCGSPTCERCERGSKCIAHDNCASGVCKEGKCADATCSDGVMNGTETGIDCGVGCPWRCATPM